MNRSWIFALCLALFAYTLSPSLLAAQEGPAAVTAEEERSYTDRESAHPELGEFTGGFHGVVIGILLIAVVVVVILIVLDVFHRCDPGCPDHVHPMRP